MAAESTQFQTRRTARDGQKSQLKERIGQLEEQIQGLSDQITAKAREIQLITQELDGVRNLWRQKLVPLQRVSALERDLARIEGEKGALTSSIAQTRGRITETRLQILQIGQDLRTEVGKDLADTSAKLSEYVERKVTAEDQLKRVDIRAPQDGIVHQLSVHTVGGVVAAGEPIMLIVPTADHLILEAKVSPQEIDQVHLGQVAALRFSAFNQRTTPEVDGTVSLISPDLTTDPRTGQSFYTIRIALPQDQLTRLGGAKLTPGMPAEAFLRTHARTVLTYLTKPLTDQLTRSFRER
jgi:HlyD family secretion protein